MAAVGELEDDYADLVRFTVVPPDAPRFGVEVEEYGLGTHGLVGFDAGGEVVTTTPGHEFGKQEIVDAIEELLP